MYNVTAGSVQPAVVGSDYQANYNGIGCAQRTGSNRFYSIGTASNPVTAQTNGERHTRSGSSSQRLMRRAADMG